MGKLDKASLARQQWLSAAICAGLGLGLLAVLQPYDPFSETSPDYEMSRGLAGLSNFDPPFRLVDKTELAGVRRKQEGPRTNPEVFKNEAPRFLMNGAAAASVDIDRDGWPDLFVTNSAPDSKPYLWRNNRNGTFSDVAAKWGLDGVNKNEKQSGAAAFFDFDNDGDDDLFLHRLSGCAGFFENTGSRFTEKTDLLGARVCGYGTGVNVFDFDRDGYLDVVATFWSREGFDLLHPTDTRILWDANGNASNGSRIYLLKNEQGKGFRDVTAESGLGEVRAWLWAVSAMDIDDDGWTDLYFGHGWGRDLFFHNQKGKFTDESWRFQKGSLNSGMGVEIADFDNNLRDDVFVAVIYEGRHINWGNNFYLNLTNPAYPFLTNTAKESRNFNCGWAWGVKAVDFDLDGTQEAFMSNGYITRETDHKYDFEAMTAAHLPRIAMEDDRFRTDNLAKKSYAGNQRDCLFYSHSGRYWDIGPLVGITDRGDGRAVVSFDYDNDGRVDLFVVNQNSYPVLYKNVALAPSKRNKWIGVSLKPTAGSGVNRNAFDARVTLLKDGHPIRAKGIYPSNGYLSQNDPRVLFGLGPEAQGKFEIQVRWPDGQESKHNIAEFNRYVEIRR